MEGLPSESRWYCPYLLHSEEVHGDFRRQTFEEIWNGEEYVKLRRAFVEQSGIPATCYRCTDPLRTWGLSDVDVAVDQPGQPNGVLPIVPASQPGSSTEDEAEFTFDWFSDNIPLWKTGLARFVGKPNLRFLEVGCFEGQSTIWLLENILTGDNCTVTVVDSFEGGADHHDKGIDFARTEELFHHNTARNAHRLEVLKGLSQWKLREIEKHFDFVFIDGSHAASDVLEDAVLSFRLLKPGGVNADDLEWDAYTDEAKNPRIAIEACLRCFAGQFDVLSKGYQLILEKR